MASSITRLLILILLNTLVLSLNLEAQTFSGQVRSADSAEPLLGATVWLPEPLRQGTLTDTNGWFSIPAKAKTATVEISYLGYETFKGTLLQGDTLLILLKASSTAMQTVVVKAERMPARQFATEQINRLDVYLNPASKADVLLAVNSLPAATNPDETANVSLRGTPAEATGIVFNRVPLRDAVRLDQPNGVGQFSIFNTAIIDRVTIFPSNGPVSLGQSTAGTVALSTGEDLPARSRMINANLVGGGFQFAGSLGKQTGGTAYLNWSTHRLLQQLNPAAMSAIRSFQSIDVGLFGVHRFSPRSKLLIFNLSLFERYSYRLHSGSLVEDFDQRKDRNQTIVNWIWQRDSWRLEWNQGLNLSTASYQLGNILTQPRQQDYFSGLWASGLWRDCLLTFGANFETRSTQTGGTYPLLDGAWAADHPSGTFVSQDQQAMADVFTYLKKEWNDRWQIGGGLKWLAYHSRPGHPLAAQLNLNYLSTDEHRFTLGGGTYYQLADLRSEVANSGLHRSRQLSLDWEKRAGYWRYQAAVYRMQATISNDAYHIWGVEGQVRYQRPGLSLWCSATHSHSRIESAEGRFPSSYDFSYLLRAGGQLRLPGEINVGAFLQWRQGQYHQPLINRRFVNEIDQYLPVYANPMSGERLPDYHRLDLSLSRIFGLGDGILIVYLNLNNAYNQGNVQDYVFDEAVVEVQPSYYQRRLWFAGATYQW